VDRRLSAASAGDADDRMARRRMQTHAIVDPAEITPLPPLVRVAAVRDPRSARSWFDDMRSKSRLALRRRAAR